MCSVRLGCMKANQSAAVNGGAVVHLDHRLRRAGLLPLPQSIDKSAQDGYNTNEQNKDLDAAALDSRCIFCFSGSC